MQEELDALPCWSGERLHPGTLTGVLTADAPALVVHPPTPPGSREAAPEVAETSFGRVVGSSPAMRRIYPMCRRLADSDLPLVIGGETGTGKELLAESIHEDGRRRKGPFVVLDCTSIPRSLAEAALFGHEKGSFTGATDARRSLFEDADGGTLLLDEIGDLDIELQAKLLRVLERSEVTRVGSTKRIKVDVRFMAATRRDLREMVRQGKFRDDLYYRLAVTRIELPPLRDRHGDLGSLVRTFWERMAGEGQAPSERLLAALGRHDWPGNVRELYNAVARCVALGEGAWFDDVARHDRATTPAAPVVGFDGGEVGGMFEEILELDLPLPKARRRIVAEFEQRYVQRALERTGGNLTQAAHSSGVGSRYFRLIRARGGKPQG